MKKARRWIVWLLIGIVLIWNFMPPNDPEAKQPGELIPATIERVVDGDTIIVTKEGKSVKVRMIGVNTPESVHSDASKNTPEGKKASNYTKSRLEKGQIVYLEYDTEPQDIYGRDLAYVWTTNRCVTNSFSDFCRFNYGAELLQNTYCEAVYYEPNGKYRDWYEQLEQKYQPYRDKKNEEETR